MRIYALASAGTISAILAVSLYMVFSGAKADRFSGCRENRVATVGSATIGGPFTLVDGSGTTVTSSEVIVKPSLLYFGYTFCPDICPLDNVRNAAAADLLIENGYEVTPVFITVDPERDTSEVVGEFAEIMHPDMIGLTGTPEQVQAAAEAYKVFYKLHEDQDGFYLVDHTTFTYLVLPEEGFVEFFKRGDEAEMIAARTACFIDAAKS